ncbi:hypothetical protein IWQ62_001201 [Dispira parvispora]|uniref:polynucleotide adenylyltransferase n=1 Tax=Dispira parvispora TaxID=1520584 RepID=A0A9W8AYF6_9FUNG|nr:hypothetical protein IWQ62_001201 [Dispira parvispora]
MRAPPIKSLLPAQKSYYRQRALDRTQLVLARFAYDQIKRHKNQVMPLGMLNRLAKDNPQTAPYLPRTGLLPLFNRPAFQQYFRIIHRDQYDAVPGTSDQLLSITGDTPGQYAKPCLDIPLPDVVDKIQLGTQRRIALTGKPLGDLQLDDMNAFSRTAIKMPFLTSDPYDASLQALVDDQGQFRWENIDFIRAPLSTDKTQVTAPSDYTAQHRLYLDQQILARFFSFSPSAELLAKVNDCVGHIRRSFVNFSPTKDYRVELVGSFATELAHHQSDVNLLVVLPNRRIVLGIGSPAEQLDVLRQFTAVLRGGGFKQIRPSTKDYPVIRANYGKFEKYTPLTLMMDDPVPYFETRLVKAYGDFDPRVRPLIQMITHWAIQRQLVLPRDPDKSTMYTPTLVPRSMLIMMVIGFLQYKGILPPLQRVDKCIYEKPQGLTQVMKELHRVEEECLSYLRQHESLFSFSHSPTKSDKASKESPSTAAPVASQKKNTGDSSSPLCAPYSPLPLAELPAALRESLDHLTSVSPRQCINCRTPLPRIPLGDSEGYFLSKSPPAWETHRKNLNQESDHLFQEYKKDIEEADKLRLERDLKKYIRAREANVRTSQRPPRLHRVQRTYWYYDQLVNDNGFSIPYMGLVPPKYAERWGYSLQRLHSPRPQFDEGLDTGIEMDESLSSKSPYQNPRPQAFTFVTQSTLHQPSFMQNSKDTLDESLGPLLMEFFRFYGHEFPYTQAMVSVRLGGIVPRTYSRASSIHQDLPGDYEDFEQSYEQLAVEHPFHIERNMAKTLKPWVVDMFAWEMRRAYDVLVKAPGKYTTPATSHTPLYFDASAALDEMCKPYKKIYYLPQFLRAYRLTGKYWSHFHPELLQRLPENTDLRPVYDILHDDNTELRPISGTKALQLSPEEIGVLLDEPILGTDMDDALLPNVVANDGEDVTVISHPAIDSEVHYEDWNLGMKFVAQFPTHCAGIHQPFNYQATVEVPEVDRTMDILVETPNVDIGNDLAYDQVFRDLVAEEGEPRDHLTDEQKSRLASHPHLDPRFPPDSPWAPQEWPHKAEEEAFFKKHNARVDHLERLVPVPHRAFLQNGKIIAKIYNMAFSWKAANLSYLQYSQICAAALRNVVKEDLRAAASKRQGVPIKLAKWDNGKIVDSKILESITAKQ